MSSKIDKILNLASEFETKATKFNKKASVEDFYTVLVNYEENWEAVRDFALALKQIVDGFAHGSDMKDPKMVKIHHLLHEQSQCIERCIPELKLMDVEINKLNSEE